MAIDQAESKARILRAAEDIVVRTEHSTYKVSDFIGWQRDGSLELRPRYQRGQVWTAQDKSFLIDSILKGYPIPLIVLQEEVRAGTSKVTRRVVDGQQRLRTVIGFVEPSYLPDPGTADGFEYRPPGWPARLAGLRYDELTQDIQDRILRTRLPVVLLDAGSMDRQVLEVYDRLNSTGAHLVPQELRFAHRDGRFADLCYRLARANQARWTDWRLFTDTAISRMSEVEFVSELVLLHLRGVQKTGRRELDAAYRDDSLKKEVPGEETLYERFNRFMDAVDSCLAGPSNRNDPFRMFRRKTWFYSLFAWFLAGEGVLGANGAPHDSSSTSRKELDESQLRALMKDAAGRLAQARATDEKLARALAGSSSDRASRMARFYFLENRRPGEE